MSTVEHVEIDSARRLCIHFKGGAYYRQKVEDDGTVQLRGQFAPADLNKIARVLNRASRQERADREYEGFAEDC